MERRNEPRFNSDQPVRITILGGNKKTLEAKLVDVSGRGMQVEVSGPIAPGTPVKVEIGDALVLAETTYTRKVAGRRVAGLRVDQVLSGLSELMRLHRSLLAEQRDQTPSRARAEDDAILPIDAAS